jgi:hypothetical protein
MGVLTDFFLATPSDVSRVLLGWQLPPPPLPRPVVVHTVNPFTKQRVQITSRRDLNNLPEPKADAAPSPDISSLPNVQCKGLLPDKLALAFSALTDISQDDAVDLILCGDLIGPPDGEITVLLLPQEFMVAVAAASAQDIARAARAIIDEDEMSNPEDASALEGILREVQILALRGKAENSRLFIWLSP